MDCPKCRGPLRELLQRGVLVDYCRGCGATWFDGGELRRAVGAEVQWGQVASIALEDSGLLCPRCGGVHLEERRAGTTSTVTVDVCGRCGGVLLDRGELARMDALVRAARGARQKLLAELAEPSPQALAAQAAADVGRRQAERAAERLPAAPPQGALGLLLAALRLPYFAEGAATSTIAVWLTLVALGLVYWAESVLPAATLVHRWTMVPAEVLAGRGVWTVVTSMLAHGSVVHLLSNGYFLWLFGSQLESRFSAWRFLAVFVAAGLVGQLAVLAADPTGTTPYLGASGAVAGLMAYSMVSFPKARIVQYVGFRFVAVGAMEQPQWVYVGLWLALQLVGVMTKAPGVAWWAHLGGFGAGAVLALATRRRSGVD